MQRVIGNYWIPTVVIAMAMTLAGCGGSDAPSASSASSVVADPNAAFAQYKDAPQPFECSKAYVELYDAYDAKHYGIRPLSDGMSIRRSRHGAGWLG